MNLPGMARMEIETAGAALPPSHPMSMPVQNLREGALSRRALPTSPPTMAWRRLAVIGGAGLLTIIAVYQFWWLLNGTGIDILESLMLVLFTGLFAWIALAFTTSIAGFVLVLRGRRMRLGLSADGPLPALHTRTALLMPIYNEDADRVMAGVQAMLESLAATERGAHFDLFVLSDTVRTEIQLAETEAFARLRDRIGPVPRAYYRLRTHNHKRKAGNIASWVRRFGGAYPHMLILDADSLMTGDTLVRLAAAMEDNEDIALIQTLPVVVNGQTLFGRMQQFASRVYGAINAHGIAWWHGAESNYWGHNAIIRTAAFAAHACLPPLRGVKPLLGNVLSHDFVEAALLRRGGWALHMVPGLGGSYEEGPPSLTDMLVRDRRWCQGNLQHAAVVPARGLHWLSRMHLMVGIGQYLTAPMWAMLILVGVAIPVYAAATGQTELGLQGFSLLDYWRAQDSSRLLWVFALSMLLLFVPKILGVIAMLLDRDLRRGCGGGLRASASALLETMLAALIAPVTMFVQSRAVAQVLAGKDSGWESQRRDDGTLPLPALIGRYGGPTASGVLAAAIAYVVSPTLLAWMSPVIAGLVLSIPLVAWTSARAPGQWLRCRGIFLIPEESEPPPLLLRAAELRARCVARPADWRQGPDVRTRASYRPAGLGRRTREHAAAATSTDRRGRPRTRPARPRPNPR